MRSDAADFAARAREFLAIAEAGVTVARSAPRLNGAAKRA
jgi:hypothetical protein